MNIRIRILVVILTVSVCLHVLQVAAMWLLWPAPAPVAAAPARTDWPYEEIVWRTKSMAIADTEYVAFVGPWLYEQDEGRLPNRYSISVETPTPTGHRPLYHLDLKTNELPAEFINKAIEDIVVYDPKTRLVSFMIGDRVYGFCLPRP
jgi:hypothetical protein